MTRPTLLLDCDGVLADFVSAYLKIVEFQLGRSHTPAEVTRWDINASLGITGVDSSNVKRAIGNAPRLARNLAVYDGAKYGVSELLDLTDLYIVTSPWNSNPTWTHDREAWLFENFGIRSNRVIHTSAKHMVRGDILVDDKTETLVEWRDAHPTGIPVMWSTPHNQGESWDGERTNSWDHLIRIVGQR